jgi:hypothetical protein
MANDLCCFSCALQWAGNYRVEFFSRLLPTFGQNYGFVDPGFTEGEVCPSLDKFVPVAS